MGSRDVSVGIATTYPLNVPRLWYRRGEQILTFRKTPRSALEPTQPPVQRVPDSWPWAKRPRHEVNRSPPAGAHVRNEWSPTSTSATHRHGDSTDNFAFTVRPQW